VFTSPVRAVSSEGATYFQKKRVSKALIRSRWKVNRIAQRWMVWLRGGGGSGSVSLFGGVFREDKFVREFTEGSSHERPSVSAVSSTLCACVGIDRSRGFWFDRIRGSWMWLSLKE
jgi:hypothetical protein